MAYYCMLFKNNISTNLKAVKSVLKRKRKKRPKVLQLKNERSGRTKREGTFSQNIVRSISWQVTPTSGVS